METPSSKPDTAQLLELLARTQSERDEYAKLARLLREELERVKRGLVGPQRERHAAGPEQLTLQMLATALAATAPTPPPPSNPVKAHTRAKPTGRNIPDSLPRVEFEVVPDEVQRAGLDAYERIGQEVSEVVERRAGGLVVVATIRGKYVLKNRPKDEPTRVLVGAPPELPIERGMAGPGLLAETIVNRWQLHLPANRQEDLYAREGMALARSTLCEWHINLAGQCNPLLGAMWTDALAQEVLMTDATGVLVQAREACRRAHFWVLVAPHRHVLFRFTARHNSAAVDGMLKNYRGFLVADAHTVYDHLYRSDDARKNPAVECGCWSHARRYFFKALDSDPARAKAGLELIQRLFILEREWVKLSPDHRLAARKSHAAAAVERFYEWVDDQAPRVLVDTPISKALGYVQNQRVALGRFLTDGRVPIHNNESERQLRREAVGRKNWLFVGSDEGAHANATFVSLLASCQMHGIEPWAYLRDLFCLLPSWPHSKVLELSPFHWKETSQRPDVRRSLENNPYRRVTSGQPPQA